MWQYNYVMMHVGCLLIFKPMVFKPLSDERGELYRGYLCRCSGSAVSAE